MNKESRSSAEEGEKLGRAADARACGGFLTRCPVCGLAVSPASGTRCPRCNTVVALGCAGCTGCGLGQLVGSGTHRR